MNIPKLKELLTLHEGLRLKPYRCTSDKLTIGVGHNLDDKPISPRAAEVMLEDDINDVLNDLDKNLPWWKDLSETRQLVLADMCFNLGIQGLLGFKNTLSAMQSGDYEKAANGMSQSLWAKQVGKRAERLIQMMRAG
jgi:lysozyme